MAEDDNLFYAQKATEMRREVAAVLELYGRQLALPSSSPEDARWLETAIAVLRGDRPSEMLDPAIVIWARCTASPDGLFGAERSALGARGQAPLSALVDLAALAVAPRFLEDVADKVPGVLAARQVGYTAGIGMAIELMCATVLAAAATRTKDDVNVPPELWPWLAEVLPRCLTWYRSNMTTVARRVHDTFTRILPRVSPDSLLPTVHRVLAKLRISEIGSYVHDGIATTATVLPLCERFMMFEDPRYLEIKQMTAEFMVRRLIHSIRGGNARSAVALLQTIRTHIGQRLAPASRVAYVNCGLLAAMHGAEWALQQNDELLLRYLAAWDAITRDPVTPQLDAAIARHASFELLLRALGGKFAPTACAVCERLVKSPAILLGMISDDAVLVLADVAAASNSSAASPAEAVAGLIAARVRTLKCTMTQVAETEAYGPHRAHFAGQNQGSATVLFTTSDSAQSVSVSLEFARKVSRRIDRDYRKQQRARGAQQMPPADPAQPALTYTDRPDTVAEVRRLFAADAVILSQVPILGTPERFADFRRMIAVSQKLEMRAFGAALEYSVCKALAHQYIRGIHADNLASLNVPADAWGLPTDFLGPCAQLALLRVNGFGAVLRQLGRMNGLGALTARYARERIQRLLHFV